jgi:S1-C subfamily serine protease
VYDSDQFVRTIGTVPVAQAAQFTLRRDGQPMTFSIQLRRRELPSVAVSRQNQRIRWQGMLLGPIPANWDVAGAKRPEHGLLVISVENNSPMCKQGVHAGSVIRSVAGKGVDAVTDLQSILNDTSPELCRIETLPSMEDAVVSGQ